jgi:uncharacterized membrane protein
LRWRPPDSWSEPRPVEQLDLEENTWRIRVALQQAILTITPGQPSAVQVGITNAGRAAETIRVSVESIRSDWISQPERRIRLDGGENTLVSIPIDAKALPANRPGTYDYSVSAVPASQPTDAGVARGQLIVQPFLRVSVRARPAEATAYSTAAYAISVRNEGNIQARCNLTADAGADGPGLQFDRPMLELDPGASATVKLTVRTSPAWLGADDRHEFTVRATLAGQTLQTTQSTQVAFIHRAMGPWRAAGLFLVMFLLAFAILTILHVPVPLAALVGVGASYVLARFAVTTLASPTPPID